MQAASEKIKTKTIHEPQKVSLNPIVWLFLIAVILTVIGLVLFYPLYLMAVRIADGMLQSKIQAEAKDEFLKFADRVPGIGVRAARPS